MQAHVAGEASIVIGDAGAFSDLGGKVNIEGQVYDYMTVMASSSSTDDVEGDFSTMILSENLRVDVPVDAPVYLEPYTEEMVAWVDFLEMEEDQRCLVPKSLHGQVPEGIRDPGTEESVMVEWHPELNRWVLADNPGEAPEIQGRYMAPRSIQGAAILEKTIGPAEVQDLSLTVQKFKTSTHMIY